MSALYIYSCPACSFSVEVWDDGHPFIADDAGKRHYFYHPCERDTILPVASNCSFASGKTEPEILALAAQRIGNEAEFLCFSCGKLSRADSQETAPPCRICESTDTAWAMELGGKFCPKCKRGQFPEKPEFGAIS